MRIIAGLYRGRILKTLPGQTVRPTGDRLRETLFDVLGASVSESTFIDAYAGSGAVGLEALSRGAKRVWLIEENAAAAKMIQSNIEMLSAAELATLLRSSVRQGLRALEKRGVEADFCFLDPPYEEMREYAATLRLLRGSPLITPRSLVIVQHSRKLALDEQFGGLARVRLLNQSSNALSFYRIVQQQPPPFDPPKAARV